MKRELIITTIIVIIIIISGIKTQSNTEKVVTKVSEKLENFKQDTIEDSKYEEEYNQTINEIYNNWMDNDNILSVYIEHNELEKVSTQLREIKGNIEASEIKESVGKIEACLSILDHIKEKQAFNIQNIF